MKLRSYQSLWVADKARKKIALKARQIGLTTACAVEMVLRAALGENCIVLSATQRQAENALDAVRQVIRETSKIALTRESRSEIELNSGAKIISIASRPESVRGFTGNVFLDEFAFHRDAEKVWNAVLPVASTTYSIRVISTPAGESGQFYDLWRNAARNGFSTHQTTIHDAMTQGLGIDLSDIRASLDEEAFRQEYECQFVDEQYSYFPFDLITSCAGDTANVPAEECYLGIDIGAVTDLTAIAVILRHRGRGVVREVITMKAASFAEQRARINDLIATLSPRRVSIDATGIGMQIAQELTAQHGSRVEGCTFTGKFKEDLVTSMRKAFETESILIPSSDSKLIADIHAIKKSVTTAGNVRFDAERTKEGHADRFWAVALSLHAAGMTLGKPERGFTDADVNAMLAMHL